MAYSRLRCPECNADFGQEVRFRDHLTDEHEIDSHEALYVKIYHAGVHPVCKCGCGKCLPWSGWKKGFTSKYLRGHNASVDSCWLDKRRQAGFATKRKRGYAEGRYKVWNDGKDAVSDPKLANMAAKTSATLQARYKNGSLVSWQSVDPERAKIAAVRISKANRLSWDEVIQRVAVKAPNFELTSTHDDYVRRQRRRLEVKCKTCGTADEKSLEMLENTPRCYACNPQRSYPETQVYEFVKSLMGDDEVISNTRDIIKTASAKGRELDVYVPSRRFAIEYNGLTFHGEHDVARDYHSNKTDVCAEKGITLMHVFSDEWREKNEIVKSMIRSRLGKCVQLTSARKCDVRVIKPSERAVFFDNNHIDGDVKAKRAWGLFTKEGKLVSVLSLRNPRGKKHKGATELARFSTLCNASVPGAMGKLVKVAASWAKHSGYDRVITYVDLRHGTGKSYKSVGFVQTGKTPNRFWWSSASGHVDVKVRYDRIVFRADGKNNLSEKEVAKRANVFRVWCCPNLILALDLRQPI